MTHVLSNSDATGGSRAHHGEIAASRGRRSTIRRTKNAARLPHTCSPEERGALNHGTSTYRSGGMQRRTIISPESIRGDMDLSTEARRRRRIPPRGIVPPVATVKLLPTKNPIGHACPAGGPACKSRCIGSTTTSRPPLTYLGAVISLKRTGL